MKTIRLVFKSGAVVTVSYSAKVYAELDENLGKDHVVHARNFTLNTKNLEGIFFEISNEESNEE